MNNMNLAQEIYDKFQKIISEAQTLNEVGEDGSQTFAAVYVQLYYVDNEEVTHLETVRDIGLILDCGIEINLEVEFVEYKRTDESDKIYIFTNRHGLEKSGDGSTANHGRITTFRKTFKKDKAAAILEEYGVLDDKAQEIAPDDYTLVIDYFNAENFRFESVFPIDEKTLKAAIQSDKRLFFRVTFEETRMYHRTTGATVENIQKITKEHGFRVVDIHKSYNRHDDCDEIRYVLEKPIN